MSSDNPYISGAYSQIVDWYRRFQQVQGSKPVPLLASEDDPAFEQETNQPRETDPSTPMLDIIA